MKKAISLVLSVLMICTLVFAGCGSKAEGGDDLANTTWTLTSGKSGGQEVTGEQVTSLFGEIKMEFKADSKMSMTAAEVTQEGTYKLDGSKLTLSIEGQDQECTYENGSITMESAGATLTFSKK
ncbi:lipocalin family protein [Candidatus Soleaferrea massiliensis]|uniref:lipocalin family protein n=1 Tax=Candidatus Soleaferrea massiliensis TaxID=1470354 RepID=UPI00058BC2DA|nr:lipocalin family protein [Candidatus Soleaferrea massiliensis]